MLALLQNSNDDSSGSRAGSVVAHALEFLGKRRLDRQAYYATQQIHYPGSTARIDDAKKGA
jgi:hypothetical protein